MAAPPDLRCLVEAAGIDVISYQLDSQSVIERYLKYCDALFARSSVIGRTEHKEITRLARENSRLAAQCVAETRTALMSLAAGADLLFTGQNFEQPAFDVAEALEIPFATLHFTPIRCNGQVSTFLPPAMADWSPRALAAMPPWLLRGMMHANDWLNWRITRESEDAQRSEVGLPKTSGPWPWRISERGSMEIQAYDEVLFPGLSTEWARWNSAETPRRPFVGALGMELTTDSDAEVLSWIGEGTPPVFFGFGSMPVESADEVIGMVAGACRRLGLRVLIGAGSSDFSRIPAYDHVKLVGTVNFATVFPRCCAVIHHGSTGTTAAGLRAGVPTLILWRIQDQLVWGNQIRRLGVGTARRRSATTEETLTADLSRILAPDCRTRARGIAARMTQPTNSVPAAAELLERLGLAPM